MTLTVSNTVQLYRRFGPSEPVLKSYTVLKNSVLRLSRKTKFFYVIRQA